MDDGRGDNGRKRGNRGSAISGTEFAGVGVQFGLTILVFVWAGVWLDRRFGTSPWLLLICVFAGAGGAFYSMYRRVTAAQRDAKHKK
jgi:ATP synthase protein I